MVCSNFQLMVNEVQQLSGDSEVDNSGDAVESAALVESHLSAGDQFHYNCFVTQVMALYQSQSTRHNWIIERVNT